MAKKLLKWNSKTAYSHLKCLNAKEGEELFRVWSNGVKLTKGTSRLIISRGKKSPTVSFKQPVTGGSSTNRII